ncbi:MAG: hypothetical protein OER21_05925 [Gemmatimonadota bacterium]|nr:hypothetical protein [Gemmatimonadota bacterium]
MLAYVFWHWSLPQVAPADYEQALRRFHAALAQAPPAGFLRSWTHQVTGAPWVPGPIGYEDWYLLDGSAALDPLDVAAVSGRRQEAHDGAARLAAGGTAGLYQLRAGAPLPLADSARWFGKPVGVGYADFLPNLERTVAGRPFAVWMRRMVLGPTPEFCLHVAGAVTLPPGVTPLRVGVTPLGR